MGWTSFFSFSPARRATRSFLFFLYTLWLALTPHLVVSQDISENLDQDSIDYYLQVVDEGEKQVGITLAKIGKLYQNARRYNSALTYYDQALPLLNGEGRSIEAAQIHRSKGVIFEFFGDNAQPQTYYRLARNSYLKAAQIFENHGTLTQQMIAYQHLADIATKRMNFNRAVSYQNQVIKALTRLYQDSIQAQAESFNDLLNKEIESSSDTVFLETPPTTADQGTGIGLTNWRHLLILALGAGLLIALFSYVAQRRVLVDLQEQQRHMRSRLQQLEQQNEELQTLNMAITKTEKEQRRSSLTKDKLFSIISHDLRGPINTISGFLNILRAKLSSVGDIELRDLAMEMIQTTDRLSHFLDDLLKWSMTQLGQIKPKVEKVNVKKLVEENYLLAKSRLKTKNIHFKASVPDSINIYADTNMVRLILRNLIGNAIKFTRQDGYISVSLKSDESGMSLLEVADDGIGMSEEQQQEIFEFRASQINGGNSKQGAGLGLLLCKEFARLNKGDIEVSSKLGEGTVFRVYLPASPITG